MARRYYRGKESGKGGNVIAGIIAFFLLGLWGSFEKNPQGTGAFFGYVILAILTFFVLRFSFRKLMIHLNNKRFEQVVENLKQRGQEEYLKNFISRFGLENSKIDGWVFRNHVFEWDRINDLKKFLGNAKITSKDEDVFDLLRHYIQEKEEALTLGSMKSTTQQFGILSGEDFEKLLYRLFEKMGYLVQKIGHTGDQGGDLIVSKNGERILVQAKCYRDWSTGNAAVQQVVGAMKFYDCNKSMVVTTSHFTNEAIALAKANNTELIGKERLQELLLQNLGESWN